VFSNVAPEGVGLSGLPNVFSIWILRFGYGVISALVVREHQEMIGENDSGMTWLTCPFDRSISRTFESREATSIVSLGVVGERTMLVTGAVSY
jgi:hypothetical protein